MNEKKKYRPCDILSVIGLLAIIYGFAAAMFITPDKGFSDEENRSLQTLPEFSPEALKNGQYTADIASYCTDQIPLRNAFVGAKGTMEILAAKHENNSVLLGKNGTLISKQDHNDFTLADKNTAAVNRFADYVGIPVHIAIAGRSQDILCDCAPSVYPAREISDAAYAHINNALTSVRGIDIMTPLRQRASNGEYVHYRTDHHWTTLGAYYAYAEIMKAIGTEPYPLDHFTRETATEEFYGTTWSKAGMKWVAPEPIEFFRYDGDDTLSLKIGTKVTEGLYDRSYLEKKSKYSAFLGETFASASIYPTDGSPLASESREKLLLIKDSFAHSLTPFLALHFDIELIDLRYYKFSTMTSFIEANSIDRVLILYNMDSVLNADTLTQLTLGIE